MNTPSNTRDAEADGAPVNLSDASAPTDATMMDAPADAPITMGQCPLTFAVSQLAVPNAWFTRSVEAVDVTGDNRADVVLSATRLLNNSQTPGVLVYAQTPQGTLAAPDWYPGGVGLGSMLVVDVTGDKKTDVILGGPSGLTVMVQSGGKLQAPIAIARDAGAMADLGSAAGNFDNDTLIDVVQLSQFSLNLWTQTGAAAFDYKDLLTFMLPTTLGHTQAADITADGKDDVLVVDGQKGVVTVFPQTTPATIGAPLEFQFTMYPTGPSIDGFTVGDVTGDGKPDAVVAYGGNNPRARVVVLPQKSGALGPQIEYATLDIPSGARIADVNCDGLGDVLITHPGWWNLGIYLQNKSGGLDPELLIKGDTGYHGGNAIAVADLNGDGRPDVVTVGNNPMSPLVLFLAK